MFRLRNTSKETPGTGRHGIPDGAGWREEVRATRVAGAAEAALGKRRLSNLWNGTIF